MNETTLVHEMHGLVEAARYAARAPDYDKRVFERFDRIVGFDVAFMVRATGPGEWAPGFDERVRRVCMDRWDVFARELEPFFRVALASDGAAVDRAFFGSARLERMAYYQEIMRPHGGRSTLIGYLSRRGRVEAKMVLGRTSSSADFTERERKVVAALIPTLSLCEAALRAPAPDQPSDAALARLTRRELEIVEYLQLGYTNAEIALACGTASTTVRNQLSSIFAKLGASTRAEAVALTLRASRQS